MAEDSAAIQAMHEWFAVGALHRSACQTGPCYIPGAAMLPHSIATPTPACRSTQGWFRSSCCHAYPPTALTTFTTHSWKSPSHTCLQIYPSLTWTFLLLLPIGWLCNWAKRNFKFDWGTSAQGEQGGQGAMKLKPA